MIKPFRSWLLVAVLAIGRLCVVEAAPNQLQVPAGALAADPYSIYYPQGVASAESYLGVQPDGSVPGTSYRSTDDAYAERIKAEGLRDQATTLNEYYYLSGYIDRLNQYVESGGY
jgi:hypothetical protein